MAIGPLDEDAPDPEYLTYVVEVPDLPRAVEGLLALVATVLVIVSILRVGRSTPDDAPTRPIALVVAIGAATAAGVLIGGSGRAITAGADGANIGAGLALLFVLPLAVGLALVAVAAARHRVPGAATPRTCR
jgi:hypothetical protein